MLSVNRSGANFGKMFVVTTRYGPRSSAPICGDFSVSLRMVFGRFSRGLRYVSRGDSDGAAQGCATAQAIAPRSTTIHALKPGALAAISSSHQDVGSGHDAHAPRYWAMPYCFHHAVAVGISDAHKACRTNVPHRSLLKLECSHQLPHVAYTTVLSCAIQCHDKTL